MTKFYVSADLEGVAGVVSLRQCSPEGGDVEGYRRAIAQLGRELSWVLSALFDADDAWLPDGAVSSVVINDAHGAMTHLGWPELGRWAFDARVSWISGKPKLCAMMAGLDASFHGALLVGYHAKAGTQTATLCHTFHHSILDVHLNGQPLGEGGLNTLYAWEGHEVPVIFASGDDALTHEMQTLMPNLPAVVAKYALGYAAAHMPSFATLETQYQDTLARALQQSGQWAQWQPSLAPPYQLQVTFVSPLHADTAALMPWLERVDGRTVQAKLENMPAVFQALQSCYTILASSKALEPA